MKKIILLAFIAFYSNSQACADSDGDYGYFNLFTQSLIPNKAYQPFLLTYSSGFYDSDVTVMDENIENWQKYFNNELTYEQTKALVNLVDMKHLNSLKAGKITHDLLKNVNGNFYSKYKEGIDYLIEAKYLEPFMRIKFEESPDSFYYRSSNDEKNATQLDYSKTSAALKSLYAASKNPEIKLRYGYQLVRFNHYNRKFQEAISSFKTYVEPLKRDIPIYWYALDQKAGAERGLKMMDAANYDFFQVFMHTRNRKESAYTSMRLSNNEDFQSLLKGAKNAEERNMAYFLLAYNDYSNPVSIMEKMLQNSADSDILKVLTARAINSMERSYLPEYIYCGADCDKKNNRLPLYFESTGMVTGKETVDFSVQLKNFIAKARAKSDDEFWQMADAYVLFLNRDYAASTAVLNKIKTTDTQYSAEISKLKMLNDIVSQPKITPAFEVKMMQQYGSLFTNKKSSNSYYNDEPDTNGFIRDILANRYFLQGEDGKSFLMNNTLSNLQFNPNSALVKKVDAFYQKKDKNIFEQYIAGNFNDVGNTEAFFNVIYGDFEMRKADFNKAKNYYESAQKFTGIPRTVYNYDGEKTISSPMKFSKNEYDGFKNVSSLIFGHNVWESFESSEQESMMAENTQAFPFITDKMTKLELAKAALQLEKAGTNTDARAAKANQLLGNLLYNTSILGYYRHVFVMDVNNANGPKYDFGTNDPTEFHFYYKNFAYPSIVEPTDFDISLNYYKRALSQNTNREDQARILFQMASAEQGKYYQAPPITSAKISYDDANYEAKMKKIEEQEALIKNNKYRNSFAVLKAKYADTKTVQNLKSSCLYFGYYMRK